MITFTCPACQAALESPDHTAGQKVHCPKCGQRLLIPPPMPRPILNRTMLGQATTPLPTSSSPPPEPVVWVGVRCYDCDRAIPEGESVRHDISSGGGGLGAWWPLILLSGGSLWLVLLLMGTSSSEEYHRVSICLECSNERIQRQNWSRALGCVVFLAVLLAIGIITLVVLSSHH
jgi:DNA-directed RNA polymerase subunit RPC12/RpoP